jgi:hypothetical protein
MGSTSNTSVTGIPGQVQLVLSLVAAGFLVGFVRAALMKDWSRPVPAVVGLAILAAVSTLWMYGLCRRVNWLRWLTVTFFALIFLAAPWVSANIHNAIQISIYWVQFLIGVAVVILLCMPVTRQWFTTARVA